MKRLAILLALAPTAAAAQTLPELVDRLIADAQAVKAALPAPAPTPTPTPTPAPTPAPVPTASLTCKGIDDTAALQAAFNAGNTTLPAATCAYSTNLRISGKTNVTIQGAGKDVTVLKALNPLLSSVIVAGGSGVTLKGFTVTANATARTTDGLSRGIYVDTASNVAIDSVAVRKVAGAGILYYNSTGATVTNSLVDGSLADAFHFTGTSNVLAQFNTALNAGDDCFASIGYGTGINRNVQFLDNVCSDGAASGVSFEGTSGGQAYRNKLTRTGVSAIRVASISGWGTGAVDSIDLRDNVLDGVRTRTDIDHAAVMVFTDLKSVTNVSIANTTITNPNTVTAFRVLNYTGGISGVTINGAKVTGTMVKQCLGTLNASPVKSGVTLNGVGC
jgi:hypothetical protein